MNLVHEMDWNWKLKIFLQDSFWGKILIFFFLNLKKREKGKSSSSSMEWKSPNSVALSKKISRKILKIQKPDGCKNNCEIDFP